jgi:hypothetical protein
VEPAEELLVGGLGNQGSCALDYVQGRAAAGHTGHAAEWKAGYEGKNRRARVWIEQNREELVRPARRPDAR